MRHEETIQVFKVDNRFELRKENRPKSISLIRNETDYSNIIPNNKQGKEIDFCRKKNIMATELITDGLKFEDKSRMIYKYEISFGILILATSVITYYYSPALFQIPFAILGGGISLTSYLSLRELKKVKMGLESSTDDEFNGNK